MKSPCRIARASALSASLLALAPALPCPGAEADTAALFPFVLPWDDASPGPASCADLLHRPAGKFGPVRVSEDGHFQVGGQRIRFLGVNLSFAGGMPQKQDADKLAGRLAKFGINVCRFHHMDTGKWPNGIRSRDARESGALDPEAVERLDYFIARLKDQGIYANLNLLVGRPFNAADGLPAEIEKLDWKDRHIVGFWDARHLALQQEYARTLLTHRNPHTGLTYAEDPAVAFVEINNEQGLVHAWLGGEADRLPEVFLADLKRQWNAWLARRHNGTDSLRSAWAAGEQPLGAELTGNGNFLRQTEGWSLEQHQGAKATIATAADLPNLPTPPPGAKALRLEVIQPGREAWHVQLSHPGLKLVAGRSYTLTFWAKANAEREVSVGVRQAHEPWEDLGLGAGARTGPQWRRFKYVFTARQTDDRGRVVLGNLGGAGTLTTLAAVSLREGGVAGLATDEVASAGTVPLFTRTTIGERTAPAQLDWMKFLQEREDQYWQAMYRYLKNDLKAQAPVTGTIVGCSPPNLMARMDWVDTHAYWQHPHFPRRPWDEGDWIVNNRTMVNERGGTLPGLARKRVFGKPHACTEYNHPAPNTYCSEGFLLLAAYAALQDWDAIYAYSYAHTRGQGWDLQRISGFFDIDQHPTKMATLVPAAALFLRADVRPAQTAVAATLGLAKEADLLRRASAWSLVDAGQAGLPAAAALVHRVGLVTEGRQAPLQALAPEQTKLENNRFTSDTGELDWDLREPGRAVVTVNTPRSKAVIGFGGGKRFTLGDLSIEPGQGLQQGWSAITVTSIGAGHRWLVTATGYAENTDMKWHNAEKSTVGRDWGRAPSRVEGVPARLVFPHPAARLEAWALDEKGQRREPIALQPAGPGNAALAIGPRWRTLWYEVAAR